MAKKAKAAKAATTPAQPGWFGGSFAPPINGNKLEEYRELAEGCEDQKVCEGMTALINMLDTFFETPASKNGGTPHATGVGMIVKLEQEEIDRIDSKVPWPEELATYAKWFETLPNGPLRNAAFHLLWYGVELTNDREPLTTDRLSNRS